MRRASLTPVLVQLMGKGDSGDADDITDADCRGDGSGGGNNDDHMLPLSVHLTSP